MKRSRGQLSFVVVTSSRLGVRSPIKCLSAQVRGLRGLRVQSFFLVLNTSVRVDVSLRNLRGNWGTP